jgi:hypothetical protein
MNGVKTFANSYLYTRIPNYERGILEYVMKADRIDKSSEAFLGITEDVKRRQTSAVLSRVLVRDDVVLCIYSKPMPSSFKVFACKDVKTDRAVKVFIDCTGLITEKNGYMVCNKIDVFCTYLMSAMTNIVYSNEPIRLTNNSTIIQSGTECFVALASHIFDYLRLNGYAENRKKISYILAMYFQVSLLGLDREDTSIKNLAAKVSGIEKRDINAMEIYYNDEDLINIDTLLNCITSTFKTKGMSTDVFVDKWNWFYGSGTHFACELFPAFSEMVTNAYCGSYVNNQKTIEKCCGRSMVEFSTAILRVGGDVIDNGFRYESCLDRDFYDREKTVLQETLKEVIFGGGKKINKDLMPSQEDMLRNSPAMAKKLKTIVEDKEYTDKQKSSQVRFFFSSNLATTDFFFTGERKGYKGSILSIVKIGGKYLNTKDKDFVVNQLGRVIVNISKRSAENDVMFTSADAKAILKDAKEALKILDPSNALLKESFQQE